MDEKIVIVAYQEILSSDQQEREVNLHMWTPEVLQYNK